MDNSAKLALIANRILRILSGLSETIKQGFLGIQEQISFLRAQQEARSQDQLHRAEQHLILKAELQIPGEIQQENRTSGDRQFKVQAITAIATVLAFVAAAIYAYFAALQLSQMKVATEKAGMSADAAKRAADTSARELELAERPWVTVDASLAGPLTFDHNGGSVPI